jgi:hypothetical protein
VLVLAHQEARTKPAVASNKACNASPRLIAVCGFTDLWTSVKFVGLDSLIEVVETIPELSNSPCREVA